MLRSRNGKDFDMLIGIDLPVVGLINFFEERVVEKLSG